MPVHRLVRELHLAVSVLDEIVEIITGIECERPVTVVRHRTFARLGLDRVAKRRLVVVAVDVVAHEGSVHRRTVFARADWDV